jgi:hypothetical protein
MVKTAEAGNKGRKDVIVETQEIGKAKNAPDTSNSTRKCFGDELSSQ